MSSQGVVMSPVQLLLLLQSLAAALLASDEVCNPATAEISPNHHTYAVEGLEVSRISFSSCHLPEYMKRDAPNFWWDVRRVSKPDLWLWLGDNMYRDGNDINAKRREYNKVREEESYKRFGLVNSTERVIPIMACWDDHDYGYNDAGNDYPCGGESQTEWAHHVNIPPSEPQHPNSPHYRPGVYNSRMFVKPGSAQESGVHVILLDNRLGRDPTYDKFGSCKGSDTKMLSSEQWQWVEEELERESEIKIIGSGVQVLPPTNQITRPLTDFCAHDSHNAEDVTTNTFLEAIARVGESSDWYGVPYEMWGEIPQQRERLLGLAQRSVNRGKTKVSCSQSETQYAVLRPAARHLRVRGPALGGAHGQEDAGELRVGRLPGVVRGDGQRSAPGLGRLLPQLQPTEGQDRRPQGRGSSQPELPVPLHLQQRHLHRLHRHRQRRGPLVLGLRGRRGSSRSHHVG